MTLDRSVSVMTSFCRRIFAAIRAAGVERWEKLFTNLRSSCITDMVERKYSEKFLDAMFGNSAFVRSRYYIQFRRVLTRLYLFVRMAF